MKKNYEENFKWFQENYGNTIGKSSSNSNLILLILWKNFVKFFWNNFNEIGKKVRRNLRNSKKKCKKYFAQTLKKKKHSNGNFVKFSKQFLEKFIKNITEISNNFKEKLKRNTEEILKIFGALLKIYPETLQGLIRHWSLF